jgi:signal transduction histidine kinase
LSWAALPLNVEGRRLGGLGIGFAEARDFDGEERDFIVTLSRLCAHALDRANLYDSEKRARAEAEAVRRGRENLLTVVSHDLRNPLSAIATTASILTKTEWTQENAGKIQKCADNILRATYRADRLIADLLDLAKMESGRLVVESGVYDLNSIIKESVDVLLPLASRKELALRTALPPSSPVVRCDRERVLQVLSNLLGNALKFTSPGDSIDVVCEEIDGAARVSVSDSGCGIAETEKPHIFERYWQAKSGVHDGIGLGLSIARGLIEAQAGRIWVESQLDRGATFYFTLPLQSGTALTEKTVKSFVGL